MADEDVAQLRRVAYGRESSAAARAEAEAALRALAELPPSADGEKVAGPTWDGKARGSLERGDEAGDADDELDDGEVSTPFWGRRIRVGWVVPMVAGALVIGVLGALQVTGQFGPKSQVEGPMMISPTDAPPEGWIQMAGDVQAADAWFDGTATASDAYPFEGLLESNDIDLYEVRFALASGGGWNVWVGRSTDRKLCLLIADAASESGAAGCIERARFAINGAHLTLGERSAHWYGAAVMTSPDPESLTDSDTAPALPSPAQGNVAAALAWFAQPPTEADEFPLPQVLADLGVAGQNVRKVFGEAPPTPAVWVAKREVDGFCLIMTEWPAATASSCATVEEFRESGLSLEARGFSTSWDGEKVAAG